jgi:hypothetical protein
VICDDHDPADPDFREELLYRLFRFYGVTIGDENSAAVLESAANLVANALTAKDSSSRPRPRPDRPRRVPAVRGRVGALAAPVRP